MHAVVVSYLEWLRWVATGWFRSADRVVQVKTPIDGAGMTTLMARAPDLAPDDNAFLIARLDLHRCQPGREFEGARGLGDVWLALDAVESFHPLSERGARLLAADAERASVKMGPPISEPHWQEWREGQIEQEAHWRGNALCEALGLYTPELPKADDPIGKDLKAYDASPSERAESLGGTRMFGWSAALAIAERHPELKQPVREFRDTHGRAGTFERLKSDYNLEKPFLHGDDLSTSTFDELQKDFDSRGQNSVNFCVMATILHYSYYRKFPNKFPLESFLLDIEEIGARNLHDASVAAYFIGRSMENVAVTTLLYISKSGEKYVTVSGNSFSLELNIESRVQNRQIHTEESGTLAETGNIVSGAGGSDDAEEAQTGLPDESTGEMEPARISGPKTEPNPAECSEDAPATTVVSPETPVPAPVELLPAERAGGKATVTTHPTELPGLGPTQTDTPSGSDGIASDVESPAISPSPKRKVSTKQGLVGQPDLSSGGETGHGT